MPKRVIPDAIIGANLDELKISLAQHQIGYGQIQKVYIADWKAMRPNQANIEAGQEALEDGGQNHFSCNWTMLSLIMEQHRLATLSQLQICFKYWLAETPHSLSWQGFRKIFEIKLPISVLLAPGCTSQPVLPS